LYLSSDYLASLQAEAEAAGRQCIVGGLIVNDEGRVFVQKRALSQRRFPGGWDIAGGHVEPGETLQAALAREIHEETGWNLVSILRLVDTFDWDDPAHGAPRREFDFVVAVDGDLDRPRLEESKFTEWRWVGLGDLDLLAEGRPPDDRVIFHLVRRALEAAA
jgi:8-oxo-dGTP pyrophosphatase MutT (NUDIX family)